MSVQGNGPHLDGGSNGLLDGQGCLCEEYWLAMPSTLAAVVVGEGDRHLNEIKEQSGAKFVRKDDEPSVVPGTDNFVICGSWNQITEAVRLISERAGMQKIMKEEAQEFWLRWSQDAYPELKSRAFFLPAVSVRSDARAGHKTEAASRHVTKEAITTFAVAGHDAARKPPSEHDSDVTSDAALERLLVCIHKIAEVQKEVFVGVSRLRFSDCLAGYCYANAADLLPRPSTLGPLLPKNWKHGDVHLLLVHRYYGLVLFRIQRTGDSRQPGRGSECDWQGEVARQLKGAMSDVRKEEAVLTHLVSDVLPGQRVRKTLVLPQLTAGKLRNVLSAKPELTQELCQYLEAADEHDITGHCLCADQLSSPQSPGHVASDTLKKLLDWWKQCVARTGTGQKMAPEIYKTLVARFCGPAVTVAVPCVSAPRLAMKSDGQELSDMGVRYGLLTLYPEQANLLLAEPWRVFLAGPPGTGKTVVLILMALEWLRRNHDVYLVSTAEHSRIVCCMLLHLLQQALSKMAASAGTCGRLHFLQYNFRGGADVDRATQELTEAAADGQLYVIADQVGPDDVSGPVQDFPAVWKPHFQTFCQNLLTQVPGLRLWATSCKHSVAPDGWQVEYFTRPLRCPPAVVREVEKAEEMGHVVLKYEFRPPADLEDGPPVKLVPHLSQLHSGEQPISCVQCGEEVARFLQGLIPTSMETSGEAIDTSASGNACATPPPARSPGLQYRDMVVLCLGHVTDSSGVVEGLRRGGLPVRVLETADDMQDLATGRSDVLWVSCGNLARGIERRVVVCVRNEFLERDKYNRLYPVSRCTWQLAVVAPSV